MADKSGDKAKKITPKGWMKRIKRSLQYRDKIRDEQHWERIQEYYEGKYQINNSSVRYPPINLVFGYVDTEIAKLYFKDPYVTINPQDPDSVNSSHLLEKAINQVPREINLKKEIESDLRDTLLVGHGWLKYGFAGEISEAPTGKGEDSPDNINESIKNGEIFVTHVPWEDIIFDVTLCKDPPYDCRWIAHRIIKPVSSWKSSKLYNCPADMESNVTTLDSSGKKIDDTLKDSDLEMFEAWEIWDKDANKIIVIGDGVKGFLRDDDNILEMDGLPFSMLKFNPIPKKPYPLSDIFLIEPQILERIKLRGAQLNHIKRWSRQLSVEKGAMSPQEMEKFSQGIDGGVTQREKGSAPPVPIQYASMQDEIFVLDDMIQRDSDAVIGQNQVDRGGQSQTQTKTKYELQQQQGGIATRTSKRQDKLEDFLEEVFKKVIQLMQQFQTTNKFVNVKGMTAAMATEKLGLDHSLVHPNGFYFNKALITGKYDPEVKVGSTLPLNKENKVKVYEGLLEMLPKSGLPPGNPLQMAVIEGFLRELDLQEALDAFEQMKSQAVIGSPGGMSSPSPLAPPPPGPPLPALPPGVGAPSPVPPQVPPHGLA